MAFITAFMVVRACRPAYSTWPVQKERVEEAYHVVVVAYIGWLTDNLLLKSAQVLIKSPIEILQTVRDSNLVPKEMAYRESNCHVTDNVT